MSNWVYASQVPTKKWRNAMTLPRELTLKKIAGQVLLVSGPVKELNTIKTKPLVIKPEMLVNKAVFPVSQTLPGQFEVKFSLDKINNYSVKCYNNAGDYILIGYDKAKNRYVIDRTRSGQVKFNPDFAKNVYAPRLSAIETTNLRLVIDVSSVELFADDGLSVMTSIIFPKKPYNHLSFQNSKGLVVKDFEVIPLKSIWE